MVTRRKEERDEVDKQRQKKINCRVKNGIGFLIVEGYLVSETGFILNNMRPEVYI